MSKKIRKTIRINPQINQKLTQYAEKTGETETLVIEQALRSFFLGQDYEQIAKLFLEKFDERYKNYMTRVRLASRGADENTQVLLEIMNSMLFLEGVCEEAFLCTDNTEHSILKRAKAAVKERIARLKQKKDSERTN